MQKKFGPQTAKYSRLQLGLGLSREKDYYQHYFQDLFDWFGSIESHNWFNKFGLRKVTGEKIKNSGSLASRSSADIP